MESSDLCPIDDEDPHPQELPTDEDHHLHHLHPLENRELKSYEGLNELNHSDKKMRRSIKRKIEKLPPPRLPSDIILTGTLFKKGGQGLGKVELRDFVLYKDELVYYKDEVKRLENKGKVIQVLGCKILRGKEEPGRYWITIRMVGFQREIATLVREDADKWVEALQKVARHDPNVKVNEFETIEGSDNDSST
eukprot:TRINITY_DN24002_c0_g1_i1.p1 TRINITY_DN24002_c0_g1~~TRINITY_DN24002_c0_g1_i1.p1  ORF type:complete len:193 (-),score=51.09 TRINITY_DN24002_c0_g1_i1:98-676(-)